MFLSANVAWSKNSDGMGPDSGLNCVVPRPTLPSAQLRGYWCGSGAELSVADPDRKRLSAAATAIGHGSSNVMLFLRIFTESNRPKTELDSKRKRTTKSYHDAKKSDKGICSKSMTSPNINDTLKVEVGKVLTVDTGPSMTASFDPKILVEEKHKPAEREKVKIRHSHDYGRPAEREHAAMRLKKS